MKRTLLTKTIILLLEVLLVMSLFGCMSVKKYSVDYGTSKDGLIGAKDSYRAGATVTLKAYLATDTDYSFTVDGESVFPDYSSDGGMLIYRFKMPAHDIKIEFSSHNSMVNEVDPVDGGDIDYEQTLLFDYYTAPVAIVGESFYNETTVNRGSDGLLYVNTYRGSRDKGTTTYHAVYPAPDGLLDSLMAAVKEYKMDEWEDMDGIGLDGAVKVVKYRDSSDDLIRVSSEHYPPDDGEKAFGEISGILSGVDYSNPVYVKEDAD